MKKLFLLFFVVKIIALSSQEYQFKGKFAFCVKNRENRPLLPAQLKNHRRFKTKLHENFNRHNLFMIFDPQGMEEQLLDYESYRQGKFEKPTHFIFYQISLNYKPISHAGGDFFLDGSIYIQRSDGSKLTGLLWGNISKTLRASELNLKANSKEDWDVLKLCIDELADQVSKDFVKQYKKTNKNIIFFSAASVLFFLFIVFIVAKSIKKFISLQPLQSFPCCYLEIVETPPRYVYLIAKNSISIGRSYNNDIQPYHVNKDGVVDENLSSFISKQHCEIIYKENVVKLKVLGENKAKVNNEDILEKILEDGDILKLGKLEISIHLWPKEKSCAYEAMSLRYLNNPYLNEQYVVIWKSAQFGGAEQVPIFLEKDLPPILGKFFFEKGYFYIENLVPQFKKLRLNGESVHKKPQVLLAGSKIMAANTQITVKLDEV